MKFVMLRKALVEVAVEEEEMEKEMERKEVVSLPDRFPTQCKQSRGRTVDGWMLLNWYCQLDLLE